MWLGFSEVDRMGGRGGLALVDPFGTNLQSIRLASRGRQPGDQKIILLDNGKLGPSFGNLFVIFDVLGDILRKAIPSARIVRQAIDLNAPETDLASVCTAIEELVPAGIVIALVDHGVGLRSVKLAQELEMRGVPTCLLASGPGVGFARAVARSQ